MYLTLFYGVVDPSRGQLLYANAGHPHAFVVRGTGEVERLSAMHPPMGIGGKVPYQEAAVPWTAGEDLLLLFTDGLSDGVVEGSRAAGERRVLQEALRLRGRPVSDIVSSLFQLERTGGSADDRTAVALKV
jgi:sigma-B regulation protein RsbU (phosphoserine phosphatase)